jgi:hypothetical protein
MRDEGEDNEEDGYVYEYFLCDRDDEGNNGILLQEGRDRDSDYDREDSNREDNSDYEYPDERSSFDDEANEDDYRNRDYDIDEEMAAQRYNKKQNQSLKNRLMD